MQHRYVLQSVGATADHQGAPVKTSSGTDITSFDITRTGQGTYQVQLANSDLFWTVLPPAIPRGEVSLFLAVNQ